jgi:glutamate synthase domain-containing protein 1
MRTDTEVAAYLFDLLIRKHGLPMDIAAYALAPPFWTDIERMPKDQKELLEAVRVVYGPALLNGPFAVLLGHSEGMVGLSDRVKLRPLVAAKKDDMLYVSSEECGIREVCPSPDKVWFPKAGELVEGRIKVKEESCLR